MSSIQLELFKDIRNPTPKPNIDIWFFDQRQDKPLCPVKLDRFETMEYHTLTRAVGIQLKARVPNVQSFNLYWYWSLHSRIKIDDASALTIFNK
jgi:hypothetical protein